MRKASLFGTAILLCLMLGLVGQSFQPRAVAEEPKAFAERLNPLLDVLSGRRQQYRLTADIKVLIDKNPQSIKLELVRNHNEFDLSIEHPEYAACVRRRNDGTAFALPKHKVVFIGTGELTTDDHLNINGLSKRLFSSRSDVGLYAPVVLEANANLLIGMAQTLLGLKIDEQAGTAHAGDVTIRLADDKLEVSSDDFSAQANIAPVPEKLSPFGEWSNYEVRTLDRNELETTLVRGVRRATEILLPGEQLKRPSQQDRHTENGELRWIDGQRIVTLRGTPEQIGTAHGELLRDEANTCIDSVLYTFGTAQTIISGKWFRSELAGAFAQLASHIPQRFRDENRAMAIALGQSPEVVDALNVFPEMFHCSGFALFGEATVDGKLYHGRVLDYMTTIGLQDAATNFIVSPTGKISFANVGYAGFTGSVSGMNDAQISLGEMGGRGEGQWNGVPMATLMRVALEECSTLDQVKQLWATSPRTCEYYYVFADGKTNDAVGVAAVPEKVEFVAPGQSDLRLGDGIKDAVVLSAGDRLQTLRQRVQQNYGKIDADKAMWLMSRPVAMQSNLHNVLFVPAERVLYVANADHKRPAAERPYVKIDLGKILTQSVAKPIDKAAAVQQPLR
jgi:Acyl-coenzyme A:6-aminopenicillanic acid acyl-transferase